MACGHFCIHCKEFHFCVDGFNHGRPCLDVIATRMIPQVHDSMPQVDAVALVVQAILQQGVKLAAKRGRGDFNVNPWHTSDVQILGEWFGPQTGPDDASGRTVVVPAMLVMFVPNS